jgi:hypothetical protein
MPRSAIKTGDRKIRAASPPGQGRPPVRRNKTVAENNMIVKAT